MAAPPRGRRRTAAAPAHGLHGLEEKLETTAPHPSQEEEEEEEGNSSQTFFFLLSVKVLLLGGQSWSCSAASGQNFASHFFSMQPTPAADAAPWCPSFGPGVRRTRYVVQALSQEVFARRVSVFSLVQSNYNSDSSTMG